MTKQRAFFPLFVDMNGKKVLIIGGGNVAERRVKAIASFGAYITVISPKATEYIERAASSNINIDTDTNVNNNTVRLIERKYKAGDIADIAPFIVIAATDDRQVNNGVMADAKSQNILASIADSRDECSFYFPAIAESGNYIAGIISKDGNHAGVKQTAEKIREVLNA
jgi:siroheme synthase-like protein